MKKYIPVKPNERGYTHVKIETYYNKGNTPEKRGYYISVFPVTRDEKHGVPMESFEVFSGSVFQMLTVSRKSEKSERIAEERAEKIENYFLSTVCTKNRLEVLP